MGRILAALHATETTTVTVTLSAALVMLAVLAPAYAQEYSDNSPTLVAVIDSEYVFLSDSGYGVMVGMVENRGDSHISDVQIQVRFYDAVTNAPLDVVSDRTLVDVLPPSSRVPFMITSSEPDALITEASARIVSFDSSPAKEQSLEVQIDHVDSSQIDHDTNVVTVRGTVKNGAAPSSGAVVHVAFHDAFEPPRTLYVRTIQLGGTMEPGGTVQFTAAETVSSRAHSMTIHAESDVFVSSASSSGEMIRIPTPSNEGEMVHVEALATITGVSIRDSDGQTSVRAGSPANIMTEVHLQLADGAQERETPYSIYVQIKESVLDAPVEFIAKYDGIFVGQGTQRGGVEWVPQRPGLYIAETFVWGANGVPIGNPGPIHLILVN